MSATFAYCKHESKPDVCRLRDDHTLPAVHNLQMVKKPRRPLHFLAQWREYRKMTQEQLADASGTTRSVISLLENGERRLSDKWLRRLAPVLKTTPGAILDYDPDQVPTNIMEIWGNLTEPQRQQAAKILETFKKAG